MHRQNELQTAGAGAGRRTDNGQQSDRHGRDGSARAPRNRRRLLANGGRGPRRAHPDITFPQQLSPELASNDWRPRFIDCLCLGFTSATAFSPADVLPLRAWNKIAVMAQSAIPLALLSLVVARAVNALRWSPGARELTTSANASKGRPWRTRDEADPNGA